MKAIFAVLLAAFAALNCGPAGAQDYPNKPIKLLIAFPVGGLLDTVSRGRPSQHQGGVGGEGMLGNRYD